MFTIEEIKKAHSQVKSGADFPAYIQAIKRLGVVSYEAFVSDGHIDYCGAEGYRATAAAKYETLSIAQTTDSEQFKALLQAHQQGKTDYLTFCKDCAKTGIEKWVVCLQTMTCTYFDHTGTEILVEKIPE